MPAAKKAPAKKAPAKKAVAKKAASKPSGALRVTAPLVQVKVGDRILHYYAGDILPSSADEASVENLKSLSYVEAVDGSEAPEASETDTGDDDGSEDGPDDTSGAGSDSDNE